MGSEQGDTQGIPRESIAASPRFIGNEELEVPVGLVMSKRCFSCFHLWITAQSGLAEPGAGDAPLSSLLSVLAG